MGTIFPMDFSITRQEEFKLFSYEPSIFVEKMMQIKHTQKY
jgi:hypothetical protein